MTVRTRWVFSTFVIIAIAGVAALLPLSAGPVEREIVVVARQMSFQIGESGAVNPPIQLAPGERVRITLVSADAGFDHDFVVPDWGVRTKILHGQGRTSVVVRAPDTPGTTTYVCSLHATMMKGVIEVVAPHAAAPSR
jgi:plastocyanin